MKIKVSEMLSAFEAVVAIINRPRDIPQKGKYRLGRVYDALAKEHERAAKERSALITEHGEDVLDDEGKPTGDKGIKPTSPGFEAFSKAWSEVDQEIEVAVQAIPLSALGESGSVEIHELLALGKIIVDDEK